ncbi:MAG: malonate transporter subunit MadL [Pseudomonadales bacterium]|jgi:malonate transporter MadL subunit|nr:malonate transporter subunit MadL [Pseudomonadales bacterium]MDC3358369.1 malonate transporter subunit MadL [Pseudomonadales bacterium]MDG0999577.1 malonate transporter subunit MadL [Pseudomonadales bacterium]MDG1305462.1 malonate transporter subunit MadL [Pseudomonadales bacterium]|tara:strand:- start:36 stop:416 length:381 start_codon:yes stop_codon:yes gene_type:complete
MIIYGVALLGVCLLVGVFLGELLGQIIGVKANVGGVGISMLLLIFLSHWRPIKEKLADGAASGVLFWNAMYIPIVVAMAAKQNVVGALSGGWLAISAGVTAVVLSFALVPILSKASDDPRSLSDEG